MTRAYDIVGRATSASDLASRIFDDQSADYAFVTEAERVVGVVTAQAVKTASGNGTPEKLAEELMIPAPQVQVALATDRLADVIKRMDAESLSLMPVIEDGRLAGLITREQIDTILSGKGP